jgi:hypothetical protein
MIDIAVATTETSWTLQIHFVKGVWVSAENSAQNGRELDLGYRAQLAVAQPNAGLRDSRNALTIFEMIPRRCNSWAQLEGNRRGDSMADQVVEQ